MLCKSLQVFYNFWLEKCPSRGFQKQNGWKSALVGVFDAKISSDSPTRGIFQPKLRILLWSSKRLHELVRCMRINQTHQLLDAFAEMKDIQIRRIQKALRDHGI